MKKRKFKIVVNNRLKGSLGAMSPETNKVEINVKAHKGDKAELASTIKHELMHVNKPDASEKQVYKATAKTKIPYAEQQVLLKKLRSQNMESKKTELKKKFKMANDEKIEPGTFISKMNEQKATKSLPIKERVAIMGMV